MSTTPLDQILSDEAAAEPTAEQPAETPAAEPTPDTQDATPKPDEAAAEPDQPAGEEQPAGEGDEKPDGQARTVPHAALHEEREKHRKTKDRLDALTDQIGQLLPHLGNLSGQAAKKDGEGKAPKRDFYDDPQGFVTDLVAQTRATVTAEIAQTRFDMSEAQARARHDDFDATMESLEGFVNDLPKEQSTLFRQQLRAQPDPAAWAYAVEKRRLANVEMGDPEEYRKRIREEELAKIAAEQEAAANGTQPAAEQKPVPTIPKSLATLPNAGARKGPTWSGPTPMDEILAPPG